MNRLQSMRWAIYFLLALSSCQTQAEYDAESLFKQLSPAIVTVLAYDENGHQQGQGSGVIIKQDKIVTNCHVVRDADKLKLLIGSRELAAKWIQADPSRDICVLESEVIQAPPISIRPLQDLKVGETVYTLGNPLGFGLSVSSGLISSISPFRDESVIVASVSLSPGSSGGGLFDSKGRLLGITTAILTTGQNLNIVLPADWITALEKRGVAPPLPTVIPGPEPRWLEEAQTLQVEHKLSELEEHVQKWQQAQPKSSMAAAYKAVALNEKNQTESIAALKEAVQLDDRNEYAWFLLANGLYRQGQKAEAAQILQKAQALAPNHGGVYATKAEWLILDNQLKEAYTAIQDAIRVESSLSNHWRLLGIIADKLNQTEVSAQAYKVALKLDPSADAAKQALSNVLARSGKTDAARLALEQPGNRENAETWLVMGLTELSHKRNSEAEKALRKAVEIAPDNCRAWSGLATVLSETNRLDEAEQAYDKAYALKPDDKGVTAEILTNRGNLKSKLGNKRAALLDLEQAVKIDPSYINAYRSLGILQLEARDHSAAVANLRKVVTSNIANADDWVTLGESLEALGDRPQALEALKTSEKLNSNSPRTLQALAGYYGRGGDNLKALTYIERTLKIDSSAAVNWSNKGYALLKLRRFPESIAALETATTLDSQFANAWINLGEALMRNNQTGKAIQSLEKAITLAPGALDARFYLAQSYLGSKQAEKARTHANILLKSQPEFPQALAIITLAYLLDGNTDAALTHYRLIQTKSPQLAQSVKEMAISQGLNAAQSLP